MRVVLIGPYPVDKNRPSGGVEASFLNLLEGLRVFGDVEPHVVTFVPGAKRQLSADNGSYPVRYLPGRSRFNNLTLYRGNRLTLQRALAELRPDIVHAQDAIGYGYVSLRAAGRVPVVVSIHGIVREEPKHLAMGLERLRTGVARARVQAYCIRHARYLLQPTTYPEEYFGREIRGRIVDVGNPIADRFFEVERAPERGRLLFAGTVSRGKRLLDLVEALPLLRRSVPDVSLRAAGPTPDPAYLSLVRARIAELGLEDRVTLLGPLTPAELLEEYGRASLLVLPSGQETSPMVIGEAMAVGLPVVATRVGGVPYLVEDGRTGFVVDVGDVDAIAERASRLLAADRRGFEFGAAARRVACERFRSADVAARVRDVYLAALGEGSHSARANPARAASYTENDVPPAR